MKADQMQARARHQRGEALHEFQRRHHEVARAVAIRRLLLWLALRSHSGRNARTTGSQHRLPMRESNGESESTATIDPSIHPSAGNTAATRTKTRRFIRFPGSPGALKNDKHCVTMSEAEQVFFIAPLIVTPDERHSGAEPRFRALGQTLLGRRLTTIFTVRADGTLIRVISARDMHRKERTVYEQET